MPRDTSAQKPRRLLAAVPIAFYTPETRWGFGATGTCIFNWKSDSLLSRPSNVNLAFAFTQNRQMFSVIPYHLFFEDAKFQLYGELAYNRYLYNFYGTGNHMPDDYVERYGVEFPRLRATFLYRFARYLYAGPRLVYDRFTLYQLQPGGLFAGGEVRGSEGGVVSGPAAVLMFDSRDNIYYPRKGAWAELVYFRNGWVTAGNTAFTRVAFDAAMYLALKEKNVFAMNFYTIYSPNDLPFYQMGILGGVKKMRGFYEGRYRDNNVILFQGEYRRWLRGIFGIAVFGSAGQVAPRYTLFNHSFWRFTYGAGLRVRVDPQRKVNLRIDVAVGNNKILPYFTIAEAF